MWETALFIKPSVCAGDVGEVWLPAKDGQSGKSLETPLVHPEKRRDPLLQISRECLIREQRLLPSKVLLSPQTT